jgi:hypothetical protein
MLGGYFFPDSLSGDTRRLSIERGISPQFAAIFQPGRRRLMKK